MSEPAVQFEVTGHGELPGRGGFLLGQIRDGLLQVGMTVRSPVSEVGFVLTGIEAADDIRTGTPRTALLFRERPARAVLEGAFPLRRLATVTR